MSAYYAHLTSEALLHINGPDTLKFLQGQTTCDTREVNLAQTVAGAYCNPQGRMVCDFQLAQLAEEHYALRLKADTLEAAANTFGKYIVFSKADLDTDNSDWQVFACWGEDIGEALRSLDLELPSSRYGATAGDGYLLVQMDDAGEQLEAYIDAANHPQHLAALTGATSEGEEANWQALQILAGQGRVEGPNVEEFLPQMLNYDVTGHVNFTKGCYTGQEIVARLHYRGKAKRRMYLGRLAAGVEAGAGTDLFIAGGEQNVGTLVNAAEDGDHTLCLVSATEKGIAQGLLLGSAEGSQVEILPLPYAVDEDESAE